VTLGGCAAFEVAPVHPVSDRACAHSCMPGRVSNGESFGPFHESLHDAVTVGHLWRPPQALMVLYRGTLMTLSRRRRRQGGERQGRPQREPGAAFKPRNTPSLLIIVIIGCDVRRAKARFRTSLGRSQVLVELYDEPYDREAVASHPVLHRHATLRRKDHVPAHHHSERPEAKPA
jgi:hypothetical protein